MIKNIFFIIFLTLIILSTGCVSKKTFVQKENELNSAQKQITTLDNKIKNLENERNDLKIRIKELETELTEAKDAIEFHKNKNQETEEEVKRLQSIITTQVDKIINIESEKDQKIAELKDNNLNLTTKIKEQENIINTLESEKRSLTEERDQEVSMLKDTYDKLMIGLEDEIQKGKAKVNQLMDKLSISHVEKILFDSGKADIKHEGKKVLDKLGHILKEVEDKNIIIEGHTDNVPISSSIIDSFPTNWELSTARATTVVRYLQEKIGINPSALSAKGYSFYQPLADNDTEEGRAENRRIQIVLAPKDIKKEVSK